MRLSRLIKRFLYKIFPGVDIEYFFKTPALFWYSVYFTFRYFNDWTILPAIKFNGKVSIRVYKQKGSIISVKGQLLIEKWLNNNSLIVFNLAENARLEILNDLIIGDGVKILIAKNGLLRFKGKSEETGSGITADSVIMVNKYLEVGKDCLIAWDTYLTDCDWHGLEGKESTKDTIIKDHVWVGVGAKILKGVVIEDNCIIASNTVVTQGNYKARSFISGVPGEIKKSHIPLWKREMG